MNIEKILTDHKLWFNGKGGKRANLSKTNLSCCNLHEVNLYGANLYGAYLRKADLCEADLREANLRWADLCEADLSGANLRWANLSGANLSGVIGLPKTFEWLDTLEKNKHGYIVYKRIGKTTYSRPNEWVIKSGSILEENVNSCRCYDCGCGVNFGTREWCENYYLDSDLWKCLITWNWASGVVVPYNTDGKARCERLQLLEKV